jgi:hypothetical protein
VSGVRWRRWLEGIWPTTAASPPKDSDMHCPNCTFERLTAIHIRLAPDEDHTFASCQACEWKGWSKQGGEVPLGRVLALASERRF